MSTLAGVLIGIAIMSITATKKQRIIKVHRELKLKIQSYELRYNLLSDDFYNKFQSGLLPEREEYFRWQVDYRGLQNIEESYPWVKESNG